MAESVDSDGESPARPPRWIPLSVSYRGLILGYSSTGSTWSFFVARGRKRRDIIQRFEDSNDGWRHAVAAFREHTDDGALDQVRADTAGLVATYGKLQRQVDAFRELESRQVAAVFELQLLGIAGEFIRTDRLRVKATYDLRVLDDSVGLFEDHDPDPVWMVNLNDIRDLQFAGPGQVIKGGHFFGGGFGIQGALTGMAAATVLSALTTSSSVTTIIRIEWRTGEVSLLDSTHSADQVRLQLAPLAVAARTATDSMSRSEVPRERTLTDPLDRLSKLAELHERGAVSTDEFESAKAKLLGEL